MAQRNSLQDAYMAHHTGGARYGFSYRERERGPVFAAWVGNGKRVLDLGCRDGSLTQYYIVGNTVTGVDIDPRALTLAQERLGISTLCLDLNCAQLPFADVSFEVIIAGELLEHLVNPVGVVHEIQRVLVPGGAFIGSVPNSFHWHARLAFLRGQSSEDPTHLHLFSLETARSLLQSFQNVELLPMGGIGGRRAPAMPAWLSQPLVHGLPTLFANDFLFRATKRIE